MWPLAGPALAFVAATLVALLLRTLLISVLDGRARSPNGWASLARAIRLPSVLWSVVLGFWVAVEFAGQTERLSRRLSEQLGLVLEVAVILSVTITVANTLSILIQRASERRALGVLITGLGQSVTRGTVYIVGALMLLTALGVQITPLLTALGVGGLAVALALQDTLSNLFAGAHLLADKPIRAGDYVKVGEVPGLLGEPAPFVRLIPGFGDFSLDFTLVCQVKSFTDQFLVQHELRKRILRRFRAEGIQVPARALEIRRGDTERGG